MSLEDYESEQREIITVVKNNPACNKDLIYNKLNLEKHTLALLLHKLIQLGDIYKKDDKYYSVDVSPEALAEMDAKATAAKVEKIASRIGPTSAALQQKPAEVVSAAAATVVEKDKKETVDNRQKLYGSYHRTGISGKIAMFFYQNRNNDEGYAIDEVREILKNVIKGKINPTIHNFSSTGIIVGVDNGVRRQKKYKWSGKLIYPFSAVLPDDRFIIPEVIVPKTPKTEPVITEPTVQPTTALTVLDTQPGSVAVTDDKTMHIVSQSSGHIQNIVAKCETPTLAITMIDLRIEAISAELNNLTALRNIIISQK